MGKENMDDQLMSIMALNTYGTHTKTHQGKRLSALKIGYTGIINIKGVVVIRNAINIKFTRQGGNTGIINKEVIIQICPSIYIQFARQGGNAGIIHI